MASGLEQNLVTLCQSLRDCAQESESAGGLVLFPECALTGFHRRLPESCQQARLEAALQTLQQTVQETGLHALVGSPWPDGDQMLNVAWLLGPKAPPQMFTKVGLTPSEAKFFTAGRSRPKGHWAGQSLSVIFCREVLDSIEALEIRPLKPSLILWPGFISWRGVEGQSQAGRETGPEMLERAKVLARECQAWLLQCNWPVSLNNPKQRGMGGSVVISPSGELQTQLPLDRALCQRVDSYIH